MQKVVLAKTLYNICYLVEIWNSSTTRIEPLFFWYYCNSFQVVTISYYSFLYCHFNILGINDRIIIIIIIIIITYLTEWKAYLLIMR